MIIERNKYLQRIIAHKWNGKVKIITGIAGSDGCYLKVTILNPLLKAPGRDGYYSWEELGETDPGQRKYPVRLVKE